MSLLDILGQFADAQGEYESQAPVSGLLGDWLKASAARAKKYATTPTGLLGDVAQSLEEQLPLGAINPITGAVDKAKLSQWVDAAPGMAGIMQVTKTPTGSLITEFDRRHQIAQQNAALPKEQGGLGLPPNNTAMDRAKALGFEDGWAHGSPSNNIKRFNGSSFGAEGRGTYATDYFPEASTYSGLKEGATNYPIMVKRDKTLTAGVGEKSPYNLLNAETDDALSAALKSGGYESITATQPPTADWLIKAGSIPMPERRHFVTENPSNIRSRFAAFDPMRVNDADLLGAASPEFLSALSILTGGGLLGYGAYKSGEK